jgi:hypothetical protein
LTGREAPAKPAKFSIKANLIPLRSNRLLGFVRYDYSASPEPSTIDFIIQYNQRRMAIHLTEESRFDVCAGFSPFKQHLHSRNLQLRYNSR